tara:strand:+ start:495 stop:713 length:219 start_codon:yes stop_codon:yes gene_type:complete
MRNKINQFIGKIIFKPELENKEFFFDDNEVDDVTDEIEKSLIDLKNLLGIPEDEINAAIKSRRNFKYNETKH